MNYIELYIPCADPIRSEIWMAELAEFPFDSFEQEDTCLKAYIREDSLAGCRAQVDEFVRSTGVQCSFSEIEAVNWNALWESEFEPVMVGDKCVIRAPFHSAPTDGRLDIVIMPKMSFGTGHHATTWLMTDSIIRHDFAGRRGLDMGSGTGVLAIAAAKLGAGHVDAVDIDEWAYENCVENTAANGVADKITPIKGDASAIGGKRYDFILANINRNILLADMPAYKAALMPGGLLIVSGILESDISAIKEKAQSFGLRFVSSSLKDGWASVEFIY